MAVSPPPEDILHPYHHHPPQAWWRGTGPAARRHLPGIPGPAVVARLHSDHAGPRRRPPHHRAARAGGQE
eukprot:scaffold25727_cov140-Isochrysis_galbana.AAC.1